MFENLLHSLLDWTARASVLFAAAACVCWLLRRRSAAYRAGIWRAAFAGAAALPLIAGIAPGLPWLPAAPSAQSQTATPAPWRVEAPTSGSALRARVASLSSKAAVGFEQAETPTFPAAAVATTPSTSKLSLASLLGLAWILGSALALFALGRGLVLARRIASSARPVEGARKGTRVVVSSAPQAPFVLDVRPFARPVMVLAHGDVEASSARMVELHEGQHLLRRDGTWFVLARAIAALVWPTPLVWIALRRLRRESERACDDAVLRGGVRASAYAGELVSRATGPRALPVPAMSGGGRWRSNALSERVEALVTAGGDRRPLGQRSRGAVGVVGVLAALSVAALERASATPQANAQDDPAAAVKQESDARRQAAWTRGLAELVAMQDPATGGWRGDVGFKLNDSWRVTAKGVPHVGVTGLAIEALVLAGMQPGVGPYGSAIDRGVAWLLSVQDKEGRFVAHGVRLRAHAQALAGLSFASIAGAEIPPEALRRAAPLLGRSTLLQRGGLALRAWRFLCGHLGDCVSG